MNSSRPSWDEYFITIAHAVSTRGDCRRRQYGAVVVKNNRIVSTGYNGAPPGVPGCLEGECPRGLLTEEEREAERQKPGYKDYTNCIALHDAQNAIAFASHEDTVGSTIYLTGAPCHMCSKLIKAAGIIRVVYPEIINVS